MSGKIAYIKGYSKSITAKKNKEKGYFAENKAQN